MLGIKDNRRIVKLTPNSFHLDNEDGRTRYATFYTRPYIASIFLPILTKIDLALQEEKYIRRIIEDSYETFLHYSNLETKNWKYPQIYLDSTTFNSNSGGDGSIYNNSSTDWATVRNATDAQGTTTSNGAGSYSNNIVVERGFMPFDTSSLPNDANITAATFELYITAKSDPYNDAYGYITTVQSSQASNTSLALADLDQLGATKGTDDLDVTNITTSVYNLWTLNATGRGWIDVTGWAKLGIREGHDLENQALSPSGSTEEYVNVDYITNLPKLNVTYSVPGGGGSVGFKTLLGVGQG